MLASATALEHKRMNKTDRTYLVKGLMTCTPHYKQVERRSSNSTIRPRLYCRLGNLLCHGEPGVQPRSASTIQHCGVRKSLIASLGRLTDGRSVAGSASVEDKLGIAEQRRLAPLELAKRNRSFERCLLKLQVAWIRTDRNESLPRRFITSIALRMALSCRRTTSLSAATSACASPSAAPRPSDGPHTTSRCRF